MESENEDGKPESTSFKTSSKPLTNIQRPTYQKNYLRGAVSENNSSNNAPFDEISPNQGLSSIVNAQIDPQITNDLNSVSERLASSFSLALRPSTSFDDICTVLNIACSSKGIQRVIVNIPNSAPRLNLRPQIHVFMSAGKSNFKSSIMHLARNFYGGEYKYQITYPSLVGSTDNSTGKSTDALAWNARNSILFIDEFANDHHGNLVRAFLSLLSDGEHSRAIRSKKYRRTVHDGDLVYSNNNGNIFIKTRFVAVFGTMYPFQYWLRFPAYDALLDRCISIQYSTVDTDKIAVALGRQVFEYHPYDVKETECISSDDYDVIFSFWKTHSEKGELDNRALDDMLRVYAVTKRHDEALYQKIINWESDIDTIKKRVLAEKLREKFAGR